MAVTIKIDGVDRNDRIIPATLSVVKTYGESGLCDFDTVSDGTEGWQYPNVGEPIQIENNGATYFGGIVRRVSRSKEWALSSVLRTTVNCTDWSQIFERRLAGEYEWTDTLAGDIIADIVTNSLTDEGIDTSLVEDGPTIANFRIAYATVATAFAELAKLCEGYRLFVDQDKKLRFFNANASPTTTPASYDIPVAATNIESLTVVETDEDYCNFVIGRVGQSLRDPQPESFTGDGSSTSFTLAFPCALAPTITVNGVSNTVGIASIDTGRDWYWSQGSTEIRQDADGVVLTTADTLEVTYVGIESIYVLAKDDGEIAARAAVEGGSGRYEKLLEIDQLLSRGDAQEVVDTYLYDHITIPLVATHITNDYIEPEARNLLPGTTQSLMLDGWGAQQTNYFVRSIKATADQLPASRDFQFRYEVEGVYGSLTKTVFQWFKDLAGAGAANGSRVDGDTEYFYFGVGGCDVIEVGTDIAPHWPVVHNPGSITLASLQCTTPPTTAALIVDIQVTSDGSTWASIFQSGGVTYPVGRTTPVFISNMSAAGSALTRGQWFRMNCSQAGAAQGVSFKFAAKPLTGRVGTTLFDGSQGSGVTGSDESSESILVVL